MDVEAARSGRERRFDAAIAGYALAAAVGAAQLSLLDDPARVAIGVAPFLAALVVLAVLRHLRRAGDDHLDVWLVGLAVLGAGLAAWILVRFAVALPDAVGTEFGFYRLKGRITTPLGDHNTAAGLLLPPLVAAAVLAARDRRWRLAALVITLGLTATLSRGAAAVLIVMVLAAWLTASQRRVAMTLTGALAVVVVGLVVLGTALDTAPPPGSALPGQASRSGAGPLGASVLGRVDLAVRGIEVGAEQPLTGVGLGRFGDIADDLPAPNDHAHQAFAHAFAEGGAPLLLAAVVVAVTLAVRALRQPRSRRRDLVLLGGLGLLAHAQFEVLAGRLGYEVLLACLAGLAIAVERPAPDSLRVPTNQP